MMRIGPGECIPLLAGIGFVVFEIKQWRKYR